MGRSFPDGACMCARSYTPDPHMTPYPPSQLFDMCVTILDHCSSIIAYYYILKLLIRFILCGSVECQVIRILCYDVLENNKRQRTR